MWNLSDFTPDKADACKLRDKGYNLPHHILKGAPCLAFEYLPSTQSEVGFTSETLPVQVQFINALRAGDDHPIRAIAALRRVPKYSELAASNTVRSSRDDQHGLVLRGRAALGVRYHLHRSHYQYQ